MTTRTLFAALIARLTASELEVVTAKALAAQARCNETGSEVTAGPWGSVPSFQAAAMCLDETTKRRAREKAREVTLDPVAVTVSGTDRPWIDGDHFKVDRERGTIEILAYPEGIELIWSESRQGLVPMHPPVFELQYGA